MPFVSIEFFPNRIRSITQDPDEMVSSRCREVAVAVHARSRTLIGTTYPNHHSGPSLKNSGKVVKSGGGPAWGVRYDHRIAQIHHQGARAHPIIPVRAGALYRSGPGVVTSGGSTVFGPSIGVHHPGTKANPYLTKAAAQLGLRSAQGSVAGQQEALLTRLRGVSGRFIPFL